MIAAVAGTFNILHKGHEALISRAFELGDEVYVGITSDAMASAARPDVLPLYLRRTSLEQYLANAPKRWRTFVIDDIYGPREMMDGVGVLVVSEETSRNAGKINADRESRGLPPLVIDTVPLVASCEGPKISSSDILEGRYSRSGAADVPDIAVGSVNHVKVEAVRSVMERIFGEVRVTAVDVGSGVSPQPFGDGTRQGAVNRARSALGDHELSVGIEAGVFERTDGLYDVQYCAVLDSKGRLTVGCGPGFMYPPAVAEKVRAGMTVGDAMKEVFGQTGIGRSQGAVGFLSGGLLDRKALTEQAVIAAMVPRLHPSYGVRSVPQCPSCSAGGPCPSCGDRLPPGMLERYGTGSDRSDGFLVWIEIERDGGVPSVSRLSKEVLSRVREIGGGSRVWGAVFGHTEIKPLYREICSLGAETLYAVHGKEYVAYDAEAYADAISQMIVRTGPAAVLFGASERGNELALRVSRILGSDAALGCREISASDRTLTVTDGSGEHTFRTFPQIATVVPGAYGVSAPAGDGRGTVVYWQVRRSENEVRRRIAAEMCQCALQDLWRGRIFPHFLYAAVLSDKDRRARYGTRLPRGVGQELDLYSVAGTERAVVLPSFAGDAEEKYVPDRELRIHGRVARTDVDARPSVEEEEEVAQARKSLRTYVLAVLVLQDERGEHVPLRRHRTTFPDVRAMTGARSISIIMTGWVIP